MRTQTIPDWYFQSLKKGAEQRGIAFDVSIEAINDMYAAQGGKCAISGVEIWFSGRRGPESTASLDRTDSDKPYTIENVRWVHRVVNIAKCNMPIDVFVGLCEAVASHGANPANEYWASYRNYSGGQKGGLKRATQMSRESRRRCAQKAALARWRDWRRTKAAKAERERKAKRKEQQNV